jgi:beta-glucosidase-like glycosyl hydrolase
MVVGSKGTGDWAEAYAKARELVSKLTLSEKVNITFGKEGVNGAGMLNSCAGNSGTLAKHGFDGYCFHDGPGGISGTDMVNGYPSGLHMATTWNRELVGEVALHTGREFKKKGGIKFQKYETRDVLLKIPSSRRSGSCRWTHRSSSSRRTYFGIIWP